jgi:hypothetical protein
MNVRRYGLRCVLVSHFGSNLFPFFVFFLYLRYAELWLEVGASIATQSLGAAVERKYP